MRHKAGYVVKKTKKKVQSKGVDVKRSARYDSGGRAPGTREATVPVTIILEEFIYDELEALAAKFINPKTLKSYGKSSIARLCVARGLEKLAKVKIEDLLYYLPEGPRGEVGRNAVSEKNVKTTLSIHKKSIMAVNRHLKGLDTSTVIGATTYVRMFIREQLDDVRLSDLYKLIPASHKQFMRVHRLTPRKLLELSIKAKKA